MSADARVSGTIRAATISTQAGDGHCDGAGEHDMEPRDGCRSNGLEHRIRPWTVRHGDAGDGQQRRTSASTWSLSPRPRPRTTIPRWRRRATAVAATGWHRSRPTRMAEVHRVEQSHEQRLEASSSSGVAVAPPRSINGPPRRYPSCRSWAGRPPEPSDDAGHRRIAMREREQEDRDRADRRPVAHGVPDHHPRRIDRDRAT